MQFQQLLSGISPPSLTFCCVACLSCWIACTSPCISPFLSHSFSLSLSPFLYSFALSPFLSLSLPICLSRSLSRYLSLSLPIMWNLSFFFCILLSKLFLSVRDVFVFVCVFVSECVSLRHNAVLHVSVRVDVVL
jgi:hypothetical protein